MKLKKSKTYAPDPADSARPFSTPPGPRCGVYMRVSTDQQRPDTARDELRAYAHRIGGTVAMEIVETGSGARADRPGYQRMLLAARKGEVTCVLVHRLDRWARSSLDLLSSIKNLTDVGCTFIAVDQGLVIKAGGDSISQLVLSVLAGVAQWEREIIVSRTRAGLQAARKRGQRLGRPKHSHPTVEQVVALRADGKSWRSVSATLGASINVCRLRAREGAKAPAKGQGESPSDCLSR